uniref:Iroquois homeodomain protein b n=2 Tax=Suberites domuncula TaxID=55567 RepID=D3K340_SUBDO|nr:iroquois homeodomain protein b [Suberites domuncula]
MDSLDPSPQRSTSSGPQKRRNPAVLVLWIKEHSANPYPTKAEKDFLAHDANMTQRQLKDWFINVRRVIKKIGYEKWNSSYSACFSMPPTATADGSISTRQAAAPTLSVPSNTCGNINSRGLNHLPSASLLLEENRLARGSPSYIESGIPPHQPDEHSERAVVNGQSPSPQRSTSSGPRKRCNPAVLVLWIEEHSANLYPTKAEKNFLAHYANMTTCQLNDWFLNARRSIKKIGYEKWKEKHSSYSARFSMPRPATADGSRSTRLAQFPMKIAGGLNDVGLCDSDGLKLASINYGGNDAPLAAAPTLSVPSNTCGNINSRPFPYLLSPQSSLVNVGGTHPQAANTQVAMDPTAYYQVQHPSAGAGIRPVQPASGISLPPSGISFSPMSGPNVSLFSSTGRPGSMPPQFTPSPISIATPWTDNAAVSDAPLVKQVRGKVINKPHAHSPPVKLQVSPLLVSTHVQRSPSPKDSDTTSNNSPHPATDLRPNFASPTTAESTWAATLPLASSSQHIFKDSISGGVGTQPGNQESDRQWGPQAWSNAYILSAGSIAPSSNRKELKRKL